MTDRDDAGGEKKQRHDGELPIQVEQHADAGDDGDRLLEEIAALRSRAPICIMRVSFVIRDMRKPERILLKKSIEWLRIFWKSWVRMSVSTLLLTHAMQ